jgi:hypothetical protein
VLVYYTLTGIHMRLQMCTKTVNFDFPAWSISDFKLIWHHKVCETEQRNSKLRVLSVSIRSTVSQIPTTNSKLPLTENQLTEFSWEVCKGSNIFEVSRKYSRWEFLSCAPLPSHCLCACNHTDLVREAKYTVQWLQSHSQLCTSLLLQTDQGGQFVTEHCKGSGYKSILNKHKYLHTYIHTFGQNI